MSQIDLIARIPVPDELRSAARTLLLAYAQTVRAEPGNLRFEVYEDQDASELVVVERYESRAAIEAHSNSSDNAHFNARLGELLGGAESRLQFLNPCTPDQRS